MKFFTENQFAEFKAELRLKAFEEGFKKGKAEGLHEGLTSNKEGIHINSAGIYHFKDGKTTASFQHKN
jgi:flagellar biosynthesis/type III secretory pathway protein FliH